MSTSEDVTVIGKPLDSLQEPDCHAVMHDSLDTKGNSDVHFVHVGATDKSHFVRALPGATTLQLADTALV